MISRSLFRRAKMSIRKKKRIFTKLKKLTNEINYHVSDLEIINMTNNILYSLRIDNKKDIEYSKNYDDEIAPPVDEVISNGGWDHYCSSHIWAGQDYVDSQVRKGVFKTFDHYRSDKNYI